MIGYTDKQLNKHANRDITIDIQIYRYIDIQIYRYIDIQIYRYIDKQTDINDILD